MLYIYFFRKPEDQVRQEKKSRRKLCLAVLVACIIAFVVGAGLAVGIVFLTKGDSPNSGTVTYVDISTKVKKVVPRICDKLCN